MFGGYGLVVCGYDLVGEIMRHGGDVGLIWWVSVATRSWSVFSRWCRFFLILVVPILSQLFLPWWCFLVVVGCKVARWVSVVSWRRFCLAGLLGNNDGFLFI